MNVITSLRGIHGLGAALVDRRQARGHALETLAMAAGVAALAVTFAHAGTDTTFGTSVTTMTNWIGGSGGKLAAMAAIGVGIMGAILRFDWKLVAGAVGIGLAAATGPAIVGGLITATF